MVDKVKSCKSVKSLEKIGGVCFSEQVLIILKDLMI